MIKTRKIVQIKYKKIRTTDLFEHCEYFRYNMGLTIYGKVYLPIIIIGYTK